MSDDSRHHEHAPIRTRPPIVESEPWSTAEIITFFALGLILGIAGCFAIC